MLRMKFSLAQSAGGGAVPFTPYQGANYGWMMSGPSGGTNQYFSFASMSATASTTPQPQWRKPTPNANQPGPYYGYLKEAGTGAGSDKGYVIGGFISPPSQQNSLTSIDSYPFATGTISVSPRTMNREIYSTHQEPIGNRTYIYNAGGMDMPAAYLPSYFVNHISKFPNALNANSTDVGDLVTTLSGSAGHSSETHGYITGGYGVAPTSGYNPDGIGTAPGPSGYPGTPSPGPVNFPFNNKIQKWPFSSDTNSSNVGDLNTMSRYPGGASSGIAGYNAGGRTPQSPHGSRIGKTIDKFPFATDANASNIGDLSASSAGSVSGWSSQTHAYFSPGSGSAIETVPFASDSSASVSSISTSPRNSGMANSQS